VGNYIEFLRAFVKAPQVMGSVVPSSRQLAEQMIAHISFTQKSRIVEIGPGTGAITQYIKPHLLHMDQYVGIDVNPTFVEKLRSGFPELSFIESSAEFLSEALQQKKWDSATDIISSLPWTIFPRDLSRKILENVLRVMSPDGTFSTFTYLHGRFTDGGRRLKDDLESRFAKVERSSLVWKNIPPAYVYHCYKPRRDV
jgi:phosphatidylethanolamine/phosphatidyl-N-methylethanolamine N-methyltransferase